MARIRLLVIALVLADAGLAQDAERVPLVRVQEDLPDTLNSCPKCEDSVILEFGVTAEGGVADPQVVETQCPAVFTDSALKAIRKWKYKPEIQNGAPYARSGVRVTLSCRKPNCTCDPVNELPDRSCIGVVLLGERGAPPGVHIGKVPEGTPAHEAGFRAFDIVVQFNARRLRDASEFAAEVQAAKPGEGFEAVVLRGDIFLTLSGVISQRASSGSCAPFESH